MDGARHALIIANDEYDDPGLRRLMSPDQDAAALAQVLGDASIGAFDVRVLHNETAQTIRTAVEDFFADRSAADVLLLHFSCHGLKDASGELHLALKDTRPRRLASTGLPAAFVSGQMASSRAQRIALFLDCCFGGAFERGVLARAGEDLNVQDSFEAQQGVPNSRGRWVVTASTATQYSFEEGELTAHQEQPSIFTGAVVQALTTGAADKDGDGWVGLNELFSFVAEDVRRRRKEQTPQLWTFGSQGDMHLARSRVRRVVATPLEPELAQAKRSTLAPTRFGLVDLFRERLLGDDLGMALAAWQSLRELSLDDSKKVCEAANEALAACALRVTPDTVELAGDTPEAELRLAGPPLAVAVGARVTAPWLRLEYDDQVIRVRAVAAVEPGRRRAAVELTGPMGTTTVPVTVTGAAAREAVDKTRRLPAVETPPESVAKGPPESVVKGSPEPVEQRPRAPVVEPSPEPVSLRTWLRKHARSLAGVTAVVVALAVAGILAARTTGGTTTGGETSGGEALPQGERLGEDVLVWSSKEGEDWGLRSGTAHGSADTLVDDPEVSEVWPAISPDRRTVLYLAQDGSAATLRVVATDGTGDRVLFPGGEACPVPGRPSWSPDGTMLALVCFDQAGQETCGACVLDLEGNLVTAVDERRTVRNPTWTPDGSMLVYARDNGADIGGSPGFSLWAAPSDGQGEPVRLTSDPTVDFLPAVSPASDGDELLVAFQRRQPGEPPQIWTVTVTLGSPAVVAPPRLLPANAEGASNHDPTWSPAGDELAFSRDGVLVRIDPESETAEFTTLFPGRGFKAAWGPR